MISPPKPHHRYAPGDLVCRTSAYRNPPGGTFGPAMTVVREAQMPFGGVKVWCSWMVGDVPCTGRFSPDQIAAVECESPAIAAIRRICVGARPGADDTHPQSDAEAAQSRADLRSSADIRAGRESEPSAEVEAAKARLGEHGADWQKFFVDEEPHRYGAYSIDAGKHGRCELVFAPTESAAILALDAKLHPPESPVGPPAVKVTPRLDNFSLPRGFTPEPEETPFADVRAELDTFGPVAVRDQHDGTWHARIVGLSPIGDGATAQEAQRDLLSILRRKGGPKP